MSYKDPDIRVVPAHGRFSIESRVGDTWYVVALRERPEVAQALAEALRQLLRQHHDDSYESPVPKPLPDSE